MSSHASGPLTRLVEAEPGSFRLMLVVIVTPEKLLVQIVQTVQAVQIVSEADRLTYPSASIDRRACFLSQESAKAIASGFDDCQRSNVFGVDSATVEVCSDSKVQKLSGISVVIQFTADPSLCSR